MITKVDTSILCYSEEHLKWMFLLGFPVLIVWVISAPLVALVLLIKDHKSKEDSKVKEYFLVLYQGLKDDKFYWEFVNTLRKFLILAVFGMLSSISPRFGIIIGVVIMIIIMRFQQYLNPYKNNTNNYIEIKANEAAIITISAALIFVQDNSTEFLNVGMLVLVVIINAKFLIEWIYFFSLVMSDKYKIFKVLSVITGMISFRTCSIFGILIRNDDSHKQIKIPRLSKHLKIKKTNVKSKTRLTNKYETAKQDEESFNEEEFKRFNKHKIQPLKLDASEKSKSYNYEEDQIKNLMIDGKVHSLDQENKEEEEKVAIMNKSNEFSNIFGDYMENISVIHENNKHHCDWSSNSDLKNDEDYIQKIFNLHRRNNHNF